jgi:cardiolipin synthase A/B
MANPYIPLVEAAAGSPFRPGNAFELLHNGDEIFAAMLEAIRGATSSIEFLTYVFWRGRIATEFAAALAERARAGVKVRLLIDAFGGASMDARTIWALERAGVRLAWFRPVRWPHWPKVNHRTHRKVLLIDGHTGFTGGAGIADVWLGTAQDKHHWRETHCRISGPACIDLHAGFAENWHEATSETLAPPTPEPAGTVAAQTTISSAGATPTSMRRLVEAVFGAATRRLWVTTGYFVPNGLITRLLTQAARRGVDVRVLTNNHRYTDHPLTVLAGRASYGRLLEAGVKLYEYEKTMHHAKIITADSAWATLGSTNLDPRSLAINDELNVSVVDPDIIGTLDLKFLEDLKHAEHIRSSRWLRRGRLIRMVESGTSVIRHQL